MKLNNNKHKPQSLGHPDKASERRKMLYRKPEHWIPRHTFTMILIEGSVIWTDITCAAADENVM